MKSGWRLRIVSSAIAFLCLTTQVSANSGGVNGGPCEFSAAPEKIVSESGETYVWEMQDDPSLWATEFKQSKVRLNYLSWVNSITQLDARGILQNHFRIIENVIRKTTDANFVKHLELGAKNMSAILNESVGKFRKINCLESKVFDLYHSQYDLTANLVEFGVLILKHPETNRVKVYLAFYKSPIQMGFSFMNGEMELARKDQQQGWQLQHHMHNHPLHVSSSSGDMGSIGPSEPDVHLYQNVTGLLGALVTDGRETFELSNSEFTKLRSPY